MTLEHHKSILHNDGTPLPAFKHLVDGKVWTCWNKEVDPKGLSKRRKPPISPITGRKNGWNEEGATGTYKQAIDFASEKGLSGVGLSMEAVRRAGLPIVGIDLDDAIGKDGDPLPWGKDILEAAGELQSYTDVSPSGRGYRVFAEGEGNAFGAGVGDLRQPSDPVSHGHRRRLDCSLEEILSADRLIVPTGYSECRYHG